MKPYSFVLVQMVLLAAGAWAQFPVLATEAPRPSLVRRVFCHLKWEELPAVVDSPEEICARIRQNVRCEDRPSGKTVQGKEVWIRGAGDCMGFATAIADLCRLKGFVAEVRVLTPKEGAVGHAVAVGIWQKRLWFSSNGSYGTAESLEEVKVRVAEELGWR